MIVSDDAILVTDKRMKRTELDGLLRPKAHPDGQCEQVGVIIGGCQFLRGTH